VSRSSAGFALLLALSLAAAAPTPTFAADRAPLPPHWTSEHDDEDEEGYAPPGHFKGIYGHGFEGPLDYGMDGEETEPFKGLCLGDEAARRALVARLPSYSTEFWFYATPSQGVLFKRKASIDQTRSCAEALVHGYEIERALVTEGLIHSFDVEPDGTMDQAGTRPIGKTDREYSGAFNFIHNLMARRHEPYRGKAKRSRIAGQTANCYVQGGLVWSNVCVSLSPNATRGMLLSASAGDDIREMFHMHFDVLRTRVPLDGRLFELDRDWDGPD
jgi:hypothetical protein